MRRHRITNTVWENWSEHQWIGRMEDDTLTEGGGDSDPEFRIYDWYSICNTNCNWLRDLHFVASQTWSLRLYCKTSTYQEPPLALWSHFTWRPQNRNDASFLYHLPERYQYATYSKVLFEFGRVIGRASFQWRAGCDYSYWSANKIAGDNDKGSADLVFLRPEL